MKHVLLIALLAGSLSAQTTRTSSQIADSAPVSMQSEAKEQAIGYEQAFGRFTRFPVTLVFQREDTVRIIEDVKTVKAMNGVLVVEVGKGFLYLINPKDVVTFSDGPVPRVVTVNKS